MNAGGPGILSIVDLDDGDAFAGLLIFLLTHRGCRQVEMIGENHAMLMLYPGLEGESGIVVTDPPYDPQEAA